MASGRSALLLRQSGNNQPVRFPDPAFQCTVAYAAVQQYGIPIFFIHTEPGGNRRESLPHFIDLIGGALDVDAQIALQENQTEPFSADFKNEGCIFKRDRFLCPGQRQAIVSQILQIHAYKITQCLRGFKLLQVKIFIFAERFRVANPHTDISDLILQKWLPKKGKKHR
jgi:hypothetical protein